MICHVNRVPILVVNLGNRWEFDLGHSQPGISWEFVKCAQKNLSVGKMTSKII